MVFQRPARRIERAAGAGSRDCFVARETGIHAWEDLCIHRGTRLSLGQVKNDCVICPYHYWEYGDTGQCVRIPAQPALAPPLKARANVFQVREKYGLVWVCLGTRAARFRASLPEMTILFEKWFRGRIQFRANGPRVIENFLDVAHLPFVHSGLLGDPAMPEIDDYEAQTTPDGVVAREIKVWQPNPDGTGRAAQVSYTYSVTGTAHCLLHQGTGLSIFHVAGTVTPVATCESLSWAVMALNYAKKCRMKS